MMSVGAIVLVAITILKGMLFCLHSTFWKVFIWFACAVISVRYLCHCVDSTFQEMLVGECLPECLPESACFGELPTGTSWPRGAIMLNLNPGCYHCRHFHICIFIYSIYFFAWLLTHLFSHLLLAREPIVICLRLGGLHLFITLGMIKEYAWTTRICPIKSL